MFEQKTQEILNRYNESVKLLKKLNQIAGPYSYGGNKHDSVFYNVVPRVYSFSALEFDTHEAISGITKRYGLTIVPVKLRPLYSNEKVTIKEHIKAINAITPEIFFYNAFYYPIYNNFCNNRECNYILKNNTYEDKKAHSSGMLLILNCIYLLDNPEPLTYEQTGAINKALKDSNTFIFKGCKVTLYNNGRLIIKFSNSDLFNRFNNKVNEAIKSIRTELKNKQI